ncbi:MAG: hypothetical protein JSW54_07540, partial [Fidelibacterota bacterium]
MYNVCMIGHLTRDLIRRGGETRELPGGVAYYGTLALHSLGLKVCLVTKAGMESCAVLDQMRTRGIQVFADTTVTTTIFENRYFDYPRPREQHIVDMAPPFTVDDLPDV